MWRYAPNDADEEDSDNEEVNLLSSTNNDTTINISRNNSVENNSNNGAEANYNGTASVSRYGAGINISQYNPNNNINNPISGFGRSISTSSVAPPRGSSFVSIYSWHGENNNNNLGIAMHTTSSRGSSFASNSFKAQSRKNSIDDMTVRVSMG